MTEIDECEDCGGDVNTEIVGRFRDYVCQDCGLVVDSEELVEEQEAMVDGDYDVME